MHDLHACLWFDHEALDAAKFYASIFPGSKITQVSRYGKSFPARAGQVMAVDFELDGRRFLALNGGPEFPHSPAISFVASCKTQKEIDRLWSRLLRGGGKESRCGWLSDKFGVSWQIVPRRIGKLLARPGATEAMLGMTKLDIAALERAGKKR